MAIFTLKQRIFIVKRYYQCGNSMQVVQNEYPSEFCDGDKPTNDNITELIKLFEEFGSVMNYGFTENPFTVIAKNPFEIDENYTNDYPIIKEENHPEDVTEENINDDQNNDNEYESYNDNKDDVTDIIAASVKYNEDIKNDDEEVSSVTIKVEMPDLSNTEIKSPITDKVESNAVTDEVKRTQKVQNEFITGNNKPSDENIEEFVQLFDNCSSVRNHCDAHIKLEGQGDTDQFTHDSLEIKSEIILQSKYDEDSLKFSETESHDSDSDEDKSKTDGSTGERVDNNFSCTQCDKKFRTKETYSHHLSVHEKECKICNKRCRNLVKHMATHTGERLYECNECGSKFKRGEQLKGHLVVHSDEKPYTCNTCQKSFKASKRLKAHERTHLTSVLICNICGQSYATHDTLKIHMRTHTGEKNYKCTLCDKKYSTSGSLNRHKRTHTGERPFICDICEKSFVTNNILKIHKDTVHSGDKPHQCPFCDKKYNSTSGLKIHKRVHTGEKPYSCQHCSKAFYDVTTCRKHERTHTGEKPYKCKICGQAHNQLGNLKTHMKLVHKKE